MIKESSLIYKLLPKDSPDAIVFVSGLGLDIKAQREVFVRRFASLHKTSYMALDCTRYAMSEEPFSSLEAEASQAIKKHFSKKNLFFTAACFGANIAMRLANRFPEQTKGLIITSPAINYSNPSIADTITSRIERKQQLCQKLKLKEQMQQLLLFAQLVEKMLPYLEFEGQKYIGEIKILHPQKDSFIGVQNSCNMIQALNRTNVSLQILQNETHTLKNDANLKLPILVLKDMLERYRGN